MAEMTLQIGDGLQTSGCMYGDPIGKPGAIRRGGVMVPFDAAPRRPVLCRESLWMIVGRRELEHHYPWWQGHFIAGHSFSL